MRHYRLLLAGVFLSLIHNAPAQEKHCLWKVEGPAAQVYLMGSVHVLKEDQYPLPDALEQAYCNADQVYFEVHFDSMATPRAAMLVMSRIRLPAGRTLQSMMKPAVWGRMQERTDSLGVSLKNMQQFQPWYVASNLMLTALGKQGIEPQYGLDLHFFNRCNEDHKPVFGLETLDFQLNLFTGLHDTLQSAMMEQTLDEIDLIGYEFERMARYWRLGQTDSLAAFLLEGFAREPQFYHDFLLKRNLSWMPVIESLLGQNQSTLVIVGAAHLIGKDGVVAKLREKGYSVEQL